MSYRNFFALCLLSAFAFMGCAESSSSQNDCGNGTIDPGEECDGTQIGNATCPSGQGTVKCSNTCKLDYTACSSTTTQKCGNGIIDVGETCDGTTAATCPSGTNGTVQCTNCALDYTKCAASETKPSCGNNKIDDGEECDGNLIPEAKKTCAEDTIGTPVCVSCKLVGCIDKPEAICGNNTIETGEECDGTNLNGKQCTDVVAGSTGVLTCASCKFDKSGCTTSETPTGKCGNNELDEGEDCDGAKFATGKDSCPSGTKGTVTCKACKADTSACKADSGTCEAGEETCSAADENKTKCTQDGKFAKCTSGCWKITDCSGQNKSCDESKGCVDAASEEISKCENNVYTFGTTDDYATVDCTPSGLVCDDKEGCVKNKDGITCEGTVLKLTGTTYSYDCANNKSSNVVLDRDKLGCAENVGCTDTFCKNSIPTFCAGGECIENYDCSKFGAVCDMQVEGYCKLAEGDAFKCFEDDGTNVVAMCENTGCLYDRCVSDCNDGECTIPVIEKCGDGMLEDGEDCDWQSDGSGGILYLWSPSKTQGKTITCNFYDKTKVFVSGEPTCKKKKGECKITVESCVEAADSDFHDVKSWTFTSLDGIKKLTQSGEVTMKLRPITGANGNQDVSQYSSSAWRTGGWVKASSPDFNYYLWFHTGKKITDNTVRVTFDVKTTDKGPKKVMLQYFDGESALGKSDAFSISTSYQKAVFVYKSNATIENFGFKLTAYSAGDGLMDVKDINVQSLNAI